MFSLTPEQFRIKVAEALESGEYKQGKGLLCNKDNEYCCLGVACDVYIKNGGGLEVLHTSKGIKEFGNISAFLPIKVRDALGFSGRLGQTEACGTLASLNDRGIPFSRIAKLFRNPPKGLLK